MQEIKKTTIPLYRSMIASVRLHCRFILHRISKHKLLKALLILAGVVIVFAGLVILFISPITKYLVEKYDLKYTGRQITMDWAYVNPFTGNFHFENLKIHEYHSDSIFLSVKGEIGRAHV